MNPVTASTAHAIEIRNPAACFGMFFFLFQVAAKTHFRLVFPLQNRIRLGMCCMAGGAVDDHLVVEGTFEWHGPDLCVTLVASHAGSNLIVSRCRALSIAKNRQGRKPLATMCPRYVDAARPVAGLALLQ